MAEIVMDDSSLAVLKGIVKNLCPKSVIWAFGSRVDGSAHSGSDLDLAIVDFGQEGADYGELKAAVRESHIPFLIDIFELNRLPESFQREIQRSYVVLYDGRDGENLER
ncbi:nucleotidyltransferase domain-containing protein [Candidatus Haliotispira prima]|uniref:Nucleotidyltransferase domain-containing protein n=1 Tax=Candidatus Haliotispira prima TaxID=3034016 RepID=A0ABY8MLW9_9SPIO|nr:nucleotidyltransferase domain-containing protein [Candidatus Haliotispira prima]